MPSADDPPFMRIGSKVWMDDGEGAGEFGVLERIRYRRPDDEAADVRTAQGIITLSLRDVHRPPDLTVSTDVERWLAL